MHLASPCQLLGNTIKKSFQDMSSLSTNSLILNILPWILMPIGCHSSNLSGLALSPLLNTAPCICPHVPHLKRPASSPHCIQALLDIALQYQVWWLVPKGHFRAQHVNVEDNLLEGSRVLLTKKTIFFLSQSNITKCVFIRIYPPLVGEFFKVWDKDFPISSFKHTYGCLIN